MDGTRNRIPQILRDKPRLPATNDLARNDSLSSLSLDSFGSTDREIFEETVKAGLSSVNPRADFNLDDKGKAHSVERRPDSMRQNRHHKSLDRSDKISHRGPKVKDAEFERNLASGAYNIKPSSKVKKLDQEFCGTNLSRSPYSYHGESFGSAHHSRSRSSRFIDDGPPSLPARIEDPRRHERSNSLSSLSNESFGSTDKEVFERCVRMGMSKPQPKKRDEKLRVRSDDRLEARESHRRRKKEKPQQGALDKMVGEEYSKDRAILEEVIARGAGETKGEDGEPPKNVPAPSAARAPAGGAARAPAPPTGCDADCDDLDRSNECLAPSIVNTTVESEKDELNRSNESYAEVLDGSWSDEEDKAPSTSYDADTLTRKKPKLEWTDIKCTDSQIHLDDISKRSHDTWNDNTCPDDVTFPTISGSVHLVLSMRSEIIDANVTLPDLLEKSGLNNMPTKPDLTNKLDGDLEVSTNLKDSILIEHIPEPSFASLVEDSDNKFDSIVSSAIEKEAARLAAQLKNSHFALENSVTSLPSIDLDHIRPPSNLGSLLSLSSSGHWDETSHASKKSHKARKKSLPIALMVKRALTNSMHHGSSENLDSIPLSFLENVKPPSEMEHIDMDGSMISVSSIVSEVADARKTPILFDFKQPIQDFPLCTTFTNVFQDLDKVNPPSLFDEMAESTLEVEQTTAQQMYEDCISNTLNVVTDIPSGSENCTPLPSDVSSVESTPKKQRDPKYLTPKEKRNAAKHRYQTYTITDTVSESHVVLEVESEEFLTWTKSESDKSDDYFTAISESKPKRRMSAKQRRLDDRARYQTQTVNVGKIFTQNTLPAKVHEDSHIESLKQRLTAKKTLKQKRIEDAERFRTRTLSEDIPPSPTFVTKDASFENIETTTGYDSLSSSELNHQQILDDRQIDDVFRDVDSGHNEDDFELNSTQMKTYTKSFRNYLPVIESPAAVDMCVVNNLKNIEMTASYKRTLQNDKLQNPSTSDFASYEADSNSDDKVQTDSDSETAARPKPKILKPERRDGSLDSNESLEKEPDTAKAIRGRKKAMYVSPYRRTNPSPKKSSIGQTPLNPKISSITKNTLNSAKPYPSAKTPCRTPPSTKTSANTSPKKTPPNKSPSKTTHKLVSAMQTSKPLPLVRQGTFTKEESIIPAKTIPVSDKKPNVSRVGPATSPTKSTINTSPSRLPQFNRSRPPMNKASNPKPKTNTKRYSEPIMKNSPSSHSLQSNDSGKTIVLARSSRQGSTSSVNLAPSKKDVESKIASLWKKAEQTKKLPAKTEKKVWIESDKAEAPKLIRSSTFEGQPKLNQVSAAPKQKSAIGIRVSQIPSLRPKATQSKTTTPTNVKKPTAKGFTRKTSGQVTT